MKLALILFKYVQMIDDPCCYPLGFMYISAVLKKAGHDVTVFNLNLYEYKDILTGFDAVLMTGFEPFKEDIIYTAAICKERGIKTILGGALGTFCSEEMLKYVDTVIIGEGENVICQALNSTGIVKGTKPNLDTLPYPDYEGFEIEEYHRVHGIRYMGVLTSRGCPYSCKFCAQTCVSQFRKMPDVFKEIDFYIAKYGTERIIFYDNTLNIRKDRFMEICEGMKLRGLSWSAAIRVDVWDEEMTRVGKESGLKFLVVGVESFSQDKLDLMDKKITVDQIIKCLDLIQDYDIGYRANVLLGIPDETYENILEEVIAIPSKYQRIYPGLVQPYAGTGYKERAITNEQEKFLQAIFIDYALNNGVEEYYQRAA